MGGNESQGASVGFGAFRGRMHDITLTGTVDKLLQKPAEERDDAWTAAFLPAVWYASLAVPEQADRAVFRGPDGFAYLRLAVPGQGQPFQSYCVAGLLAKIFGQGLGIAVFRGLDDPPEAASFTASFGQVDGLYRFGSLWGDPARSSGRSAGRAGTTIPAETSIFMGAPTAAVLPPYIARVLHFHMHHGWKVATPKVSLVYLGDDRREQNLMVNASPDTLPMAQPHAHTVFQGLRFYLPEHLVLMALPQLELEANMTPLTQLFGAPVEYETGD